MTDHAALFARANDAVTASLGPAPDPEIPKVLRSSKDLAGRIQGAGKSPSDYSLLVHTDSQLMVGQLTQGWQVKAANLRPLVNEAGSLVQAFGRCDLVKVPRDEIVRVLGH